MGRSIKSKRGRKLRAIKRKRNEKKELAMLKETVKEDVDKTEMTGKTNNLKNRKL